MRNHACDSPTDGGVGRWEGISVNKKTSCARAGERAFSCGGVLEDFGVNKGPDGGLSSEDPGFAFLIIVLEMAQKEQSATACYQCSYSGVGVSNTMRNRALARGNVLLNRSVSLDEQTAH